jgi:Flp pilus assembly protein TadB
MFPARCSGTEDFAKALEKILAIAQEHGGKLNAILRGLDAVQGSKKHIRKRRNKKIRS